jgi:hypothetical protein
MKYCREMSRTWHFHPSRRTALNSGSVRMAAPGTVKIVVYAPQHRKSVKAKPLHKQPRILALLATGIFATILQASRSLSLAPWPGCDLCVRNGVGPSHLCAHCFSRFIEDGQLFDSGTFRTRARESVFHRSAVNAINGWRHRNMILTRGS